MHVDEVQHPGAVVAHPQTVVIEVVVRVRRRLPTRHVLACQHEHIHRIRAFNAVANGADFGDFVRFVSFDVLHPHDGALKIGQRVDDFVHQTDFIFDFQQPFRCSGGGCRLHYVER